LNLLLVDVNAVASRGYFTGSLYEVYNMIGTAIRKTGCTEMALCFDSDSCFRQVLYPEYKANRKQDEIRRAYIRAVWESFLDYPIYSFDGYEADDLIYTLSKNYRGDTTYILTGDSDLLALVSHNIQVLWLPKSQAVITKEDVYDKYGVRPYQLVDYKALTGEVGDNIPGVRGIGPKAASELLRTYGDLATIYANLENIKPSHRNKLEDGKDLAYLSRRLVQLAWCLDIELVYNSKKDMGDAVKRFREIVAG
jgi:DNA polymerase I